MKLNLDVTTDFIVIKMNGVVQFKEKIAFNDVEIHKIGHWASTNNVCQKLISSASNTLIDCLISALFHVEESDIKTDWSDL